MFSFRLSKWVARYAAFFWTAGIFLATLIPSNQVPRAEIDWPIDKIVHFSLFLGFGILWMRGLYMRFQARVAWVIAAGLLIAIGTEFLQGIMPFGRNADFTDIVANVSGLLTGVLLFRLWFRRYGQPT